MPNTQAFGMIAAEALGVPLDCVRVISGDTDFGVDLGAYSSRQTLMTGHAVKEAAESAKRQVLEALAERQTALETAETEWLDLAERA